MVVVLDTVTWSGRVAELHEVGRGSDSDHELLKEGEAVNHGSDGSVGLFGSTTSPTEEGTADELGSVVDQAEGGMMETALEILRVGVVDVHVQASPEDVA